MNNTPIQTIPPPVSPARAAYLRSQRRRKQLVALTQAALLAAVILLWETLANLGILDSFIMSQPSRIWATLLNMGQNGLHRHALVTCFETLAGFLLGVTLGNLIAFALWWSAFLSRVLAPYLVVLSALPKVALGPVIIIWVGAGTSAIIVMALAISLIVTTLEMLNGFLSTDRELIKMAQTFAASKRQTFFKIVFPSNMHTLFHSMRVNIGLSLVGVISGEFLVSKAGLGYLIVYGGQVFQMDLVMTAVMILAVVAAVLYQSVRLLERLVTHRLSHSARSKTPLD